MRGEFLGVWDEAWREIWLPLYEHEEAPVDLFCELYAKLALATTLLADRNMPSLVIDDTAHFRDAFLSAAVAGGLDAGSSREAFEASNVVDIEDTSSKRSAANVLLAGLMSDAVRAETLLDSAIGAAANDAATRRRIREYHIDAVANDQDKSTEAFENILADRIAGEVPLIRFLESVHGVLEDVCGETIANRYFSLLEAFIRKYSLRYDLRRPCSICPTLTGVFANLVRNLHSIAGQDAHLAGLLNDFEEAVRDLRQGCTEQRIRMCIQRQFNFLEAIGNRCPGVTGTTLGAICDQVGTWPHEKLKEAVKCLYKFGNDYPGIRHAGTPATSLRSVDMRDMIAVSVLLSGFTPYLSHSLDADVVYQGA